MRKAERSARIAVASLADVRAIGVKRHADVCATPIFSDAYNPTAAQGSSSVVGFVVASSPSFVLVGGNFQRVQG